MTALHADHLTLQPIINSYRLGVNIINISTQVHKCMVWFIRLCMGDPEYQAMFLCNGLVAYFSKPTVTSVIYRELAPGGTTIRIIVRLNFKLKSLKKKHS
jgi:hypothetical protein